LQIVVCQNLMMFKVFEAFPKCPTVYLNCPIKIVPFLAIDFGLFRNPVESCGSIHVSVLRAHQMVGP
jgi:hypothetical protein